MSESFSQDPVPDDEVSMPGAAELLGAKPTTLLSRIEKMGLKRSDLLRRVAQA